MLKKLFNFINIKTKITLHCRKTKGKRIEMSKLSIKATANQTNVTLTEIQTL